MEKVNIQEKFGLFNDLWSPKIVGELNGQYVKLAKVKGEFMHHHHENEDEMFLVVKGRLNIEFDDRTVVLNEGEFIIVPSGVKHKPYAENETHILLFEPKRTLNTGNTINDKTISQLGWI